MAFCFVSLARNPALTCRKMPVFVPLRPAGGGSLRYPAENKKDTEIGVFLFLVEITGAVVPVTQPTKLWDNLSQSITTYNARRAYFRSPNFRSSHSDRDGSPKGEMSAATISTRIPDAESPPMVQANSPQAAAIRARMPSIPVAN